MDCDVENELSLETIATGRHKQQQQQQQEKCCRVMASPARRARQPDSPYAYLVCFCGVLCSFIVYGCSYSYGLLFPSLLDEFKEGKAKTGNSDSFSGLLLDRKGSEWISPKMAKVKTVRSNVKKNVNVVYSGHALSFGIASLQA